jgi:hypothetical protein
LKKSIGGACWQTQSRMTLQSNKVLLFIYSPSNIYKNIANLPYIVNVVRAMEVGLNASHPPIAPLRQNFCIPSKGLAPQGACPGVTRGFVGVRFIKDA